MTWTYIATFCLGACVGMIYTFVAYELVKRKHRKKDHEEV